MSKRTPQKVEFQKNYITGIGKMGKPICSMSWDHKDADECGANAKHITALWNVSSNLTTARAVALLEHGEEMVRVLRGQCFDCRFHSQEPEAPPKKCEARCAIKDLLSKLEVK